MIHLNKSIIRTLSTAPSESPNSLGLNSLQMNSVRTLGCKLFKSTELIGTLLYLAIFRSTFLRVKKKVFFRKVGLLWLKSEAIIDHFELWLFWSSNNRRVSCLVQLLFEILGFKWSFQLLNLPLSALLRCFDHSISHHSFWDVVPNIVSMIVNSWHCEVVPETLVFLVSSLRPSTCVSWSLLKLLND